MLAILSRGFIVTQIFMSMDYSQKFKYSEYRDFEKCFALKHALLTELSRCHLVCAGKIVGEKVTLNRMIL
jgi:hypothetical protein